MTRITLRYRDLVILVTLEQLVTMSLKLGQEGGLRSPGTVLSSVSALGTHLWPLYPVACVPTHPKAQSQG